MFSPLSIERRQKKSKKATRKIMQLENTCSKLHGWAEAPHGKVYKHSSATTIVATILCKDVVGELKPRLWLFLSHDGAKEQEDKFTSRFKYPIMWTTQLSTL